MALDKTDLEYIKNTIEWLNEHTVLIDDNRTNCETLYSSVQNSLQVLESALAKNPDASESNCTIDSVVYCPSCGQGYEPPAPQCCIACSNFILD
jgi:hypothetical protein